MQSQSRPHPDTLPGQAGEESRKGKLEVITVNVNSWAPFRNKWSTEGLPKELLSATVLSIQEHHLVSDAEIGDAEDWLRARGYHAVFQPALKLQSGKTSGGVALAVRDVEDVGVTDLQLQYGDLGHRVLDWPRCCWSRSPRCW